MSVRPLSRPPRRAVLLGGGAALLSACGGASAATPTPAASLLAPTAPPAPVRTIDPSIIRTGSAVVPSPTNQSPTSPTIGAPTAAPPTPVVPPSPAPLAPTVPLPMIAKDVVLQPLVGGQPFMSADGKATLRYPNDWEVVTVDPASQFTPRNTKPDDANAPRVNFIGQAVQLDLAKDVHAQSFAQLLASQTRDRGATDLKILSIDRIRVGAASGPTGLRITIAYTTTLPVVSEQIIVQAPGSERTYFFSATAPASGFDTTWRPIIDGMAGSLIFKP